MGSPAERAEAWVAHDTALAKVMGQLGPGVQHSDEGDRRAKLMKALKTVYAKRQRGLLGM